MPKGVEHRSRGLQPSSGSKVHLAVMPKGVEHGSSQRGLKPATQSAEQTALLLGYEGRFQTTIRPKENAVKKFLARHAARVSCTLSGFDRLVFRGTLLPLMPDRGMFNFLTRAGIRLLDFKDYVSKTSERVKEAALAEAEKQKRPIEYLDSPKASKEELAKRLLTEHPLDKPGLVCAFKAVEPCMSFEYHRSPDPKERGLKLRPRKCLHVYKYFVHPLFGFMNARIQTWFPFNIQVCLNGAGVACARPRAEALRFQARGQLLHPVGQPGAGATLDGRATRDRLAGSTPGRRAFPQSIARRNLSGLADGLLLVCLSDGVGD